jgi:hypothetical protein
MTGWKAYASSAALGTASLAGLIYLFGSQFAGGEVYSEYSSLRADPAGTRLLYDSLAGMPGVQVERNYLPLESLSGTNQTILLLALAPDRFDSETMEHAASRGNRVVVSLTPKWLGDPGARFQFRRWHLQFGVDSRRKGAHRLYFATAPGWTEMERVGSKPLAIERSFGKGSVVLLAESGDFSNESTAASDRLDIVTAALGANAQIVFDESHLGTVESGSVVGLARRYRMVGFAFGFAICAILYIGRSASSFPPAVESAPAAFAGRTSASGLITLLRKHIPPAQLTAASWQEWLAANSRAFPPERIERAAAIARGLGAKPPEAASEIHAALHPKGDL